MSKPDMKQCIDLDSSTYFCPCGASHTPDLDRVSAFDAWIRKHKPHSSGYVTANVTADGMRILANDPGSQRRRLE